LQGQTRASFAMATTSMQEGEAEAKNQPYKPCFIV